MPVVTFVRIGLLEKKTKRTREKTKWEQSKRGKKRNEGRTGEHYGCYAYNILEADKSLCDSAYAAQQTTSFDLKTELQFEIQTKIPP